MPSASGTYSCSKTRHYHAVGTVAKSFQDCGADRRRDGRNAAVGESKMANARMVTAERHQRHAEHGVGGIGGDRDTWASDAAHIGEACAVVDGSVVVR